MKRRRGYYPRILYVVRLVDRVSVRLFFDDGAVGDYVLPVRTPPRRVSLLHGGFGLKWGGPMEEHSSIWLYEKARPARVRYKRT